jgi:methionyl aminopeptidase
VIRRHTKLRLNADQRQKMRVAGQFNAQLMDEIRSMIRPGIKTIEIDRLVYEYTQDHGHTPACLGYPGERMPFPKSCCISINDVICHGIPGERELMPGDIANVDLTTIVYGWHGDQSEMFLMGEPDEISDTARAVTQCAFDTLYLAINATKPGCQVAVIGETIVEHTKRKYGFGVVDKYVGHGIGAKFHQRPNIPHVPTRQSYQERLYPGMCFTIEPMINGGSPKSVCDRRDGWTVRTYDGQPSAQFEHTILMTEEGPEILTLTQQGPKPGHQF